jgi:hypothetical protein
VSRPRRVLTEEIAVNNPTTAVRLAAQPTDEDLDQLLGLCGLVAPVQCGTVAGYMRHVRVGDGHCEPCTGAYRAAHAEWAHKPRGRRSPHGTAAGARAHQYRHEPACGPCARAYNAYLRDYKRKKRQAAA